MVLYLKIIVLGNRGRAVLKFLDQFLLPNESPLSFALSANPISIHSHPFSKFLQCRISHNLGPLVSVLLTLCVFIKWEV